MAIVHRRKGIVQGTRHWLVGREPAMHHHVALGDSEDVARLWRFIVGEALGFVACGGGAYCAAHVGIYQAFREAGVGFDLIGGTSGGAAMAAAIAQDADPLDIDAGVHRMFIEGRAMARYTVPRYSLLDHAHFDHHLEKEYGVVRIEDLWKPYFAVSADLTAYEPEVQRRGSLWQAIRASAAIPGLLPPFYTDDGRMLVDGSVIANVPIDTMHRLKRGPNVVVSFDTGDRQQFPVDYASLPKRRKLIFGRDRPCAEPDGQSRAFRTAPDGRRLASRAPDPSRNGRARLAASLRDHDRGVHVHAKRDRNAGFAALFVLRTLKQPSTVVGTPQRQEVVLAATLARCPGLEGALKHLRY